MATAAVFIALGGTSYAVTQISGSRIKNRSIVGQKLKLHTVSSGELRDLTVSSGRRLRRAKAATVTSSSAPATIITLSVGQSATVLQSGPFSYIANCTADSSGHPLVTIQAASSEAGSLLAPGTPVNPGQPVVASGPPTSDQWVFLINGARMIAPSGAALTVNLSYGTGLYGAPCWASGFGVS
jgi:hypothetical protein